MANKVKKIDRVDNWVQQNYWRYQAYTKIPLLIFCIVVVVLHEIYK